MSNTTQEGSSPSVVSVPAKPSMSELIKLKLAEAKAKALAKDSQKDTALVVVDQIAPAEQLQNGVALVTPERVRTELSQSAEYAQYYAQLCELEQKLNEKIPDFVGQLRYLHRSAAEDPNVVTIMTEDEIGIIVRGLSQMVQIEIIEPKVTKTRTKKLANVDSDDI